MGNRLRKMCRGVGSPMFRALFFFTISLVLCSKTYAQNPYDYLLQGGSPTFSTADTLPGGIGFINIANGNLHLEIPLGSYPQRGHKPYAVKLVYDSRQWYNSSICGGWCTTNGLLGLGGSNIAGGWSIRTSEDVGSTDPVLGFVGTTTSCGSGSYTTYYETAWFDPSGSSHLFPINLVIDQGCGKTNILSSSGYATDGSGLQVVVSTLNTNLPFSATIYTKDGTAITPALDYVISFPPLPGKRVDANGNFTVGYTDVASPPTDTLGRQPLMIVPPQDPVFFGMDLPTSFNVLNSQSAFQTITPNWEVISGQTYFHTASPEANWGEDVLQKLTLPDNTTYTFTYDCYSSTGLPACSSPAGRPGYFGLLTGITLPTGASIQFVYSTLTDANNNVNEWVTQRTDSLSGNWIYSLSTTCGTNCQAVTVTKPSGDQSVYTFDLSSKSGAWNNDLKVYTGTASGTPLMEVQTIYNQFAVSSTFGTFGYTHPTSTTVKLSGPNGSLLSKQTAFDYDSYSYTYTNSGTNYTGIPGKLKSKSEYAYGSSTLYRKTVITYQDDSNQAYKTIDGAISDIQLQNGTGGVVGETKISYDTSALVSDVTASVNHDPNYNASYTVRGNPTTIQRLVSSGNYLSANLTYDTTGQIRTSTDWSGNLTTYGYADNFFFDNGGTTSATPFSPQIPTNAFLTYVKPPLIPASKVGYYFGTGQTASKTDANNNTSYLHFYDPLNRPTSTQLPNGGWTYFNYPNAAKTPIDTFQAIASASPSASCTGTGDCRNDQVQLDTLGRTLHALLVSDPDGQTSIDIGYDSNGRVHTVTNPHRSSSSSTDGTETYPAYDGLDRKLQVTRPDGSIAHTYYGAAVSSGGGLTSQLCSGFGSGYPVLNVDEAGSKHQSWTDAFVRLIEVDEPNYSTNSLLTGTCYSYDLNDNLIGVLSLGGSEATCSVGGVSYNRCFSYDSASRLLSAFHPESGTTTYVNDQDTNCPAPNSFPGQLISRTDARGKRTCFQYDALNRITQTNYSDSTPTVQYFYDQNSFNGLTISKGLGRRTGMSDASGLTAWSYDAVGNVKVKKQTLSNVTPSVTKTFSYTYNFDGSVATVQYPSGRTLTYQSGDAQRPISAVDLGSAINYATNAHYAPHGALASLIYGNNQYFTSIYNNRLQPCWRYANAGAGLAWNATSCTASAATGSILDLKYNFNLGATDNGNVIGTTNNRDNFRSQAFTYDYLNRLATAQSASTHVTSPTECWSEVYGFDAIGNLLSIQPTTNSSYTGCATENLSVGVNTHNQISSPSGYVYDPAGNLTGLTGLSSYTYDAESQITSATTTSSTGYVYDGDGNRVEKTSGGTVYKIYWFGVDGTPLTESDGNGNITDEYVFFSGKRIAHRVGP